jgi:hypothetical protein
MLWDIVRGVVAVSLLLALFPLVLTGLAGWYRKLLEKTLAERMARPDLIAAYARFAAVLSGIER